MIGEKVKELLSEVPENVTIVAAIKTRTVDEVNECIEAGINNVGENYMQEAVLKNLAIGNKVKWHLIGPLQTHKAKAAAKIFDMIETIDCFHTAEVLNKHCRNIGKVMPVLLEINSAREEQKSGYMPEILPDELEKLAGLENIRVQGLMTMGPQTEDGEVLRPYFRNTKKLFDEIKKASISGIEMKYLSMGMTASYHEAIEEGANIVRIGSLIFGPRNYH
jgi:pyridoxal phosphate enzyme (YggS family)